MRMWTSACVVLAWTLLAPVIMITGLTRIAHPVPASTRTPRTTSTPAQATPAQNALTRAITTTTPATPARPATPTVTAATPAARYAVQPGDTLTGIAARLSVPGGWPALYAANRAAIGPDPAAITAGTVLVRPGHSTPARYTITAGDTLTRIAAQFAIPGGWPALYAANQQVIGPNPGAIRPGTTLTIPRTAPPAQKTPAPPAAGPARHPRPGPPAPRSSAPATAGPGHHQPPATAPAPAAHGLPAWLKTLLLALGLVILTAFLTEPVLAIRRHRHQAAIAAAVKARKRTKTSARPELAPAPASPPAPAGERPDAPLTRVVFADHDRLIVTRDQRDGTVYVLRPPGQDPRHPAAGPPRADRRSLQPAR
jgi:LysM repeat protein